VAAALSWLSPAAWWLWRFGGDNARDNARGGAVATRALPVHYPQPGRIPRYDPCIDNKVDVYLNKPEVGWGGRAGVGVGWGGRGRGVG